MIVVSGPVATSALVVIVVSVISASTATSVVSSLLVPWLVSTFFSTPLTLTSVASASIVVAWLISTVLGLGLVATLVVRVRGFHLVLVRA
ncbi:hypothetical protein WDU94_006603, partial [Cyamophila willieti]